MDIGHWKEYISVKDNYLAGNAGVVSFGEQGQTMRHAFLDTRVVSVPFSATFKTSFIFLTTATPPSTTFTADLQCTSIFWLQF